jgi:geranylgeranyl diphosphate synthase type II
MELKAYLSERGKIIDRALDRFLPKARVKPPTIHKAMRYSLFAGGKQLRPALTLAAAEACGGEYTHALPAACAVECIHTYSLIHDDLPCMDDDDLRRGRPTNHKVYGEAMATLAGDGLLTDAFKVLARCAAFSAVSASAMIETISELADAAGSAGMVGGQVIDLMGEGRDLTLAQLEVLHGKKTGALFVASLGGGARLGGGTAQQIAALREYGQKLGLAFQVADDLLDVESTAEQIGKRTHKDEARGKATYPSLIGIERSRQMAHDLAVDALEAISGFDHRAAPLRALASYAVERRS